MPWRRALSTTVSVNKSSSWRGACSHVAGVPFICGAGGFHAVRISSDGQLRTAWHGKQLQPEHELPLSQAAHSISNVAVLPSPGVQDEAIRPSAPPGLVPQAAPAPSQVVDTLAGWIQESRRVMVITGAGVSTESNIPDYRGPQGAYSTGFTPMTHQQFMSNDARRARYWARSFVGWHTFACSAPSGAHEGLARLQQRGWVEGIITQNVDRLHHRAGADRVLELHGTTHLVMCMSCGERSPRPAFQDKLAALNPAVALYAQQVIQSRRQQQDDFSKQALQQGGTQVPAQRPDGDMELVDAGQGFKVPGCPSCGGVLKPDVVFFGDAVPPERAQEAMSLCSSCDMLLVLGSSLQVWSAFRLVRAAKENGARLAIVNVGPTRADDICDLKVPAVAGEVMLRLAAHASLLIPRV